MDPKIQKMHCLLPECKIAHPVLENSMDSVVPLLAHGQLPECKIAADILFWRIAYTKGTLPCKRNLELEKAS